jgi:hypothetical protein
LTLALSLSHRADQPVAVLPRTSGDRIRHVLQRRREELRAPEWRDNTERERREMRRREGKSREMRRMWMEKKMKIKGLFAYVYDH